MLVMKKTIENTLNLTLNFGSQNLCRFELRYLGTFVLSADRRSTLALF